MVKLKNDFLIWSLACWLFVKAETHMLNVYLKAEYSHQTTLELENYL